MLKMTVSSGLSLTGILLVALSTSGAAQTVSEDALVQTPIRVVYPKEGQVIAAIDSTFILGSVAPGWTISINGKKTRVHASGGWLSYTAIEQGEFVFQLQADSADQSVTLDWPVLVPKAPLPDSFVAPLIYQDYRLPMRAKSFNSGELVQLQCRATPACVCWAEIPGVADSIPMSEREGLPAPFYGSSVWEKTDSVTMPLIRGVYQGLFEVPTGIRFDSLAVIYHLAAPNFLSILKYLGDRNPADIDFQPLTMLAWNTPAVDTGASLLYFNPPEFPRTIEFTDTVQVLRVGPQRGYLGLFQPAGVRALATGFEGDWYKVRLSESRIGYVHRESAQLLAPGILPPHSRLTAFRSVYQDNQLTIETNLSAQHPFSISEPDSKTLVVELFGVMMDTDWFRYDFNDPHIKNALWSQPEPDLFRLEILFDIPIWGYSAKYRGSSFVLTVNYPPDKLNSLRGKTIVVDPGHSADPGAIGPTGYTEAEANLAIALQLRHELQKKGALVIMTRSDDSDVPLYDRPKIADSVEADLFVSIHNNALPDGANPYENYGVSTYHYHTHSLALARSIHREMLKLKGQRDHGLYHGNLAVIRPTARPSVLIECGFMILPEQEAWLKTESYRKKVAKAIRKGLERFLRDYGKEKD